MSTLNQQTLADSRANERPPMLKKGNYIPWESRFRRFLDNKLEEREWMWNSIQNGPYKRPMITNLDNDQEEILEPLLTIGSDVTSHVRHLSLMDEFDKFAAKEGESLESVYERLTTLVNIIDCNNVHPIPVYSDVLYDSLVQFEPHVLACKAKKAAKNHDPLALLAYSNASSSQSHANSSYSPQPYYVIHPSSVPDYEDEYQRGLQEDSQEDKLTTAMMMVEFTYKPRMQVMVEMRVPRTESTPGKPNVQCYNCNEKGHYAYDCQKPRVCDAKYFREQMLLAMKDEAGSNLKDEENDFLLDNSYGEEIMEELTAEVLLMDRIQPADDNAETVSSYDAKAVSEVNDSSKVYELSHVKCKTIIQTSEDDQIDSNIIFNDPYVENNSGTSDHDLNAHDKYHKIQMLAYNVQKEVENKK
ncbi:retrovirus-related pol polyprotein from transposon TNT 1-94 [Tanacetum coccineum]